MCGIAGLWNRDGAAADAATLGRMLRAMAHRGPDDEGTWVRGPIALGHRRLAILDPSPRAHQPTETADGSGVLVYNGEVYNFPDLRRALEAEGATFESTGDAVVVREALRRWGPEAAVERFDGMFAFAWLDRRDGALWLGRDRLGIKPLLVARRGRTLLFASEAKGLFAHPDVRPRPDLLAVQRLAFRGRFDGAWTAFEGVEALPPGTLRRVTAEGESDLPWFRILDRVDPARLAAPAGDPRRAVEDLDRAVGESVRTHLAADVPLAVLLSGGVDSSLLAAHARVHAPGIEGWVANVGGDRGEGARAERSAAHLGMRLHRVEVDEPAWLRAWPRAVEALEHPNYGSADPPFVLLLDALRAAGRKVVLTGEGADELFGGYDRYRSTQRLWRRRARRRWTGPGALRRWPRTRRRLGEAPFVSSPAREEEDLRLALWATLTGETELRGRALLERLAPVRPEADRAALAHMLEDLHDSLGWWLLRHDRLGMAASLELRVPFLANDLIDRGLHMPARLKLHGGQGKWALKEAAARHLPADHVRLPKRGFASPEEFGAGATALLRGGFVPDLLRWTSRVRDEVLPRIEARPHLRVTYASMEIWARLFFGGATPDALAERLLGGP